MNTTPSDCRQTTPLMIRPEADERPAALVPLASAQAEVAAVFDDLDLARLETPSWTIRL